MMEKIEALLEKGRGKCDPITYWLRIVGYGWLIALTVWVMDIDQEQERRTIPVYTVEKMLKIN